jgi:hypothetical protein
MAGFDLSPYAVGGATRSDTFSGMQPAFSSALSNMFSSAPPEIQQNLRVMSGYRSPERQAQLWQGALAKYGSPEAARKWVAPPGRSQHNHGDAADLKYLNPSALEWAKANAPKFGLSFPLSNENWHVELAGARGGHPQAVASAAPTGGAASLFAPQTTPGGVSAPYTPQDIGGDFGLPSLALLYSQQQNQRQEREDEQQAEQIRRAALFGGGNGVASLYG